MSDEPNFKIDVDPVTGEITRTIEPTEEEMAEKQLWGKNYARAQAMRDLMFADLSEHINSQDIPDDKKWEMMFMMAVNSTLDVVFDSPTTDIAMETSYCFDNMLGLALANKKYGVDIIAEAKKAIETVDRERFSSDEEWEEEVHQFEEQWWDMGQPALGMRSPNDAIYETLSKYNLNEE
ncbi:MAG: hypothetical protein IK043_01710 [Candidatus Methanomethylophilaceae archaeon]|nr:hypothetical protein [Candidatus Methanomethylophilaceae archaeon]